MHDMDIRHVPIDRNFIVKMFRNIELLKRDRDALLEDASVFEANSKTEMIKCEYMGMAAMLKVMLDIKNEEYENGI